MPKFERVSDEVLRENGWDPKWIEHDSEQEGPYAVARVFDETCHCCGGRTGGHTLVNLATAVGISTTWTHDESETEAQEEAAKLNGVWLEGSGGVVAA